MFYSVNKLREFIKRCIKIHSRIIWNRISYIRFFVRTVMWDRRVDSWRSRITENDIRWNISIRSVICAIIPIIRKSWIQLREFVILDEELKIERDRFRKCCSWKHGLNLQTDMERLSIFRLTSYKCRFICFSISVILSL